MLQKNVSFSFINLVWNLPWLLSWFFPFFPQLSHELVGEQQNHLGLETTRTGRVPHHGQGLLDRPLYWYISECYINNIIWIHTSINLLPPISQTYSIRCPAYPDCFHQTGTNSVIPPVCEAQVCHCCYGQHRHPFVCYIMCLAEGKVHLHCLRFETWFLWIKNYFWNRFSIDFITHTCLQYFVPVVSQHQYDQDQCSIRCLYILCNWWHFR